MFRRNYLERVLKKMQELIDSFIEMNESTPWYDGIFLLEDSEETLGFAFVACQTFIAGTIADTSGKEARLIEDKDKKRAMKNAPLFKNQRTKIELINAVANYFKHKDEGPPFGKTKEILDSYHLLDREFPINGAFELLAEDFKIHSLATFLYEWSNHLFNELISSTENSEK